MNRAGIMAHNGTTTKYHFWSEERVENLAITPGGGSIIAASSSTLGASNIIASLAACELEESRRPSGEILKSGG